MTDQPKRWRSALDRCGECRGSGYARTPFGDLDPEDICEVCGGSGVAER